VGAGVEQVGMLDGGLLEKLEDTAKQKHLLPVDIPIGYGRLEDEFFDHCSRGLITENPKHTKGFGR
jgi:hypothetical protein